MTEEEERILAWTLLGEAANQGQRGMEAVAFVIRNRAASGRFPNNPAAVALQPNQFSTWNALSNGGNIPRARYSADSPIFGRALSAVRKVFSATPGRDPTQGATHYYAPRGMPGEAAPYWWRSESSSVGDVQIGGHIFAAKYNPKIAPVPAKRTGGADPVGNFPGPAAMNYLATGKRTLLPPIEASKLAYDPIKKEVVRIGSTATARQNVEEQRKEQQAQRKQEVRPAVSHTPVRVAGFSVPGGVTGIAVVDAERKLQENAKTEDRLAQLAANQSHVEPGAPRGTVQTKFAPNGSTVPKTEERLAPGKLPSAKLDASAQAKLKNSDMPNMPVPRPVHIPAVVPKVQLSPPVPARQALRVVVEGARTVSVPKVVAQTPADTLRAQGLSAADAYAAANAAAAARASEGGKYSRGGGGTNNADAASRVNGN